MKKLSDRHMRALNSLDCRQFRPPWQLIIFGPGEEQKLFSENRDVPKISLRICRELQALGLAERSSARGKQPACFRRTTAGRRVVEARP